LQVAAGGDRWMLMPTRGHAPVVRRPGARCGAVARSSAVAVTVAVICRLAPMGGQVTLRPVSEDDLPWLASLREGPAATGPHEWHGWSDPQWEPRQWAESGLLGDNGGTLIVLHGTDRVGSVSWRRVQTGPTAFNWAI